MKITFLEAPGFPLTKRFERGPGGQLITHPYPHAASFTSYQYDVHSLDDVLKVLRHSADQGRCLLKGNVTRDLHNESRAGSTDPLAATWFRVYDLDFDDGFDSPDDFLAQIGQAGVSYIFQHSASAGLNKPAGLRGHIFILEDEPRSPALLKEEITDLNFRIDALAEHLELSANGLSLRYPLDVSVNQNDKLIFIAPPVLAADIDDPLAGQRIELHVRDRATARPYPYVADPARNRKHRDAAVARLRKAAGLEKRTPKYKKWHGEEVLANPDGMVVTEYKSERGFHYFNLNGGDSWGYYASEDNPDIVRNFKGEPNFLLEVAAPDLYRTLRARAQRKKRAQADAKPVAFHDPDTDAYYTGFVDEARQTARLNKVSSRQKIVDFLISNGEPPPDAVEDWTVVFDPSTNKRVDLTERWLNLFQPSEFMRTEYPDAPSEPPELIHRTLFHVLGSDEEAYHRFLNWLAVIYQHRTKTGTAWLIHGNTGTGKGVLFNYILRPLFGTQHVIQIGLSNLEDQYNNWVRDTLVVFNDDNRMVDAMNETKVMDKVKQLITEPHLTIRAMRADPVEVPVFNNMLFSSNHLDSIPLPENDRRFNVAPAQEARIDYDDVEGELRDAFLAELPDFAAFLQHYDADVALARRPLLNEARSKLIQLAQNTVDAFFQAVRNGDLGYFLQAMPDAPPTGSPTFIEYERAIKKWATAAAEGRPVIATNNELRDVYNHMQATNISPVKFGRMCRLHNVEPTVHRIDAKKTARGVEVHFKATQDDLDQLKSADVVELEVRKS